MATLTLTHVPDELIQRLQEEASRQRRSIDQQALFVLEQALLERRPLFTDALHAFFQHEGPPDEDIEQALDSDGLRIRDTGREVDLT